MIRIGDFSTLAKTTVKTLRYYEKEGLLLPVFIDSETGYRYYETCQLPLLNKIMSLRQIGFSILMIKESLKKKDIIDLLNSRKEEIKDIISDLENQLSRISVLLQERESENMKYEITVKEIPSYTVFYKQGVVKDFRKLPEFIVSAGEECSKINPTLKCIEPDYCYVQYLDPEFKDKDIRLEYAQAVMNKGNESETIKFKDLEKTTAACIYHKGSYDNLREAYSFIFSWLQENNYEVIEGARECYIDGMWNKEREEDWLTEIQVPIKNK